MEPRDLSYVSAIRAAATDAEAAASIFEGRT